METFTNTTLNAALDPTNASTRTSVRPCHPSSWCSGGRAFTCSAGSYLNASLPLEARVSAGAACVRCPFNQTTLPDEGSNGTRPAATSLDSPCVCVGGFFRDVGTTAGAALECRECPHGFECPSEALGLGTETVHVSRGFWRPSVNATRAKLCPSKGTCTGGPSPTAFSQQSHTGCSAGFAGPFCASCASPHSYVAVSSMGTASCKPCSNALTVVGSLLLGLLAVFVVSVVLAGLLMRRRSPRRSPPEPGSEPLADEGRRLCATLTRMPRRFVHSTGSVLAEGWSALKNAAHCVWSALPADSLVKLRICLSFALVLAQLGSVYQVRYPPTYESLTNRIFSPLRLHLLGWIPGLHLDCMGIERLEEKLLVFTLAPMAIASLALATALARRSSALPALPFVLRLSYVVYPAVSSTAFQALGECDCFAQSGTDTPLICFLPADWRHVCPSTSASMRLRAIAWVALLVYAAGVPLLYGSLIFTARGAIRRGKPTELSRSLAFLHANFDPSASWWQLVEVARALILTGFLALVDPGSVEQCLYGVVSAVAFLVLQMWVAPYRVASNNLFAMLVSAALVLSMLSSLGVQFNAHAAAETIIDPTMLSVALYTAAFAIFPIALLTFIGSLRRRVTPAQLRELLLNDDDHPDSSALHTAANAPLPLVARFGAFSINAAEVDSALHAPLLTAAEEAALVTASREQGQSARTDRYGKFHLVDADALLLSEPGEAARGVWPLLGVPYLELLRRMSRGVAAIVDECEAHGTEEDQRWLRYVLHEAASAEEGEHEAGRAGRRLADFVAHPRARAAGLEEVHVVALRWYTTSAFARLNEPLRRPHGTHPFAATVAFVTEAIKRLRAVDASDKGAPLRLWRGLRSVRSEIARMGGTERAPLSCTLDLATAARFANSDTPLLLLVHAKSFMQQGASLTWVSCLPHEQEVVYAPCCFLKPTGRTQRVELSKHQLSRCVFVVEVTPHI